MHRKLTTISLLSLILTTYSTLDLAHSSSPLDYLRSFAQAERKGDVNAMRLAIKHLVAMNVLKLGMTQDQVVTLLGEPKSGSGIYVPGGQSIGYGKGNPGIDYSTFFWLHFREID